MKKNKVELTRKQVFGIVGNAKRIIEIGAYDGTDTNKMLAYFNEANIVSVEPNPKNIQKWHSNVFNLVRAHLFEGAISDVDGKISLFCSNDKYPGASSIRIPTVKLKNRFQGLKFDKGIKVKSVTLDNLCSIYRMDDEVIDLIWCDAQGAEKNIIEGGMKTLTMTNYLFIEYATQVHYRGQVLHDEMLKMLPDFEVVGYFQENVFLRNVFLTNEL